MVLSDVAIRRLIESGRIVVDPYDAALMQPSSLDVRVDRLFRVFRNSRYPYIDVKQAQEELTELVEVDGDDPFILHPGEFVLGSTLERIVLPDDLVARLEGKSSLGRLGLLIHSTAGFIDPGWDGHVTLELSNVANLPITIYPGMKIGQLSFVQLSEPAEKPYGSGGLGSKYQGQRGPTPSRYWKNFADERVSVVVAFLERSSHVGSTAWTGGGSWAGSARRRCSCSRRPAGAAAKPARRLSSTCRDGDAFAIVASFGGSPTHPAWYLNLNAESRGARADRPGAVRRNAPAPRRPRSATNSGRSSSSCTRATRGTRRRRAARSPSSSSSRATRRSEPGRDSCGRSNRSGAHNTCGRDSGRTSGIFRGAGIRASGFPHLRKGEGRLSAALRSR